MSRWRKVSAQRGKALRPCRFLGGSRPSGFGSAALSLLRNCSDFYPELLSAEEDATFHTPRKTASDLGIAAAVLFSKGRWFEPFMDFIDQVRDTVKKTVEGQELQDQLMLEIVTTNANEASRRVIMALPASPPPTFDQLIEECTRKAILMAEDLVKKLQEKVVAPTSATPRTPALRPPPPKRRCYYCNQEGHLISQYPFQGTAPPQGGRAAGGEFSNQQKN
ncbi:uncharacterized protein LOC128802404 isoform X1 [Vidua chalybeata]|uniref:uncharacterized protein LOC128802404 isoform X1 n=1 Tax=Vidua chalybeata TaxID=81927 RepID=UPI0023A7ED11|nr:uncharacterized protein LOC128802404 isoform X1 [Vidua chalybeata]XP_053824705.1 uncharacterized protein LOC128802404 isoform X1 [Vidua chalybeata]